ncbi:sugar ABC transporter permease [Pseudomonas sp. Choline-3u-10]|uniref:ABC transporter permease n=1 Tax=Pseudomonas sp. Choline-3u-10 TaxID=2058311 RepID=UPI000C34F888|nr:ABC transporter permease [Pseudomonas sp. Choline-3u-10]PKG93983.1 sugar ABC transporter permease [Pseudomonas sp. Choline-3u-10]
MQNFSASPREAAASLWRNRSLIYALSKREVVGRYHGSVMGLMWSFFNPLCMLAVYTFVFSMVFQARWNVASESKTEFALMLFAGLIVFNLFADCITRAPNLVIANTNYVKKVVFPLEVLSFVTMGSALFHFLVNLSVWLLVYAVLFGEVQATALLLPIFLAPLVLFILGLVWFLASVGVFLRDVGQFIGVLTSVLMFLSPIFYPITALPEQYRQYLLLNPLTPTIEAVRQLLFIGAVPSLRMLGVYLLAALAFFCMGFAWFQKTRKGFADVL